MYLTSQCKHKLAMYAKTPRLTLLLILVDSRTIQRRQVEEHEMKSTAVCAYFTSKCIH